MKNLQSLLPALIIALAVLAGLLGGAKIISNGVVEANRFQFELNPHAIVFDSFSGGIYRENGKGWYLLGESYGSVRKLSQGIDDFLDPDWDKKKMKELIPAELSSAFEWHIFKKDEFWTK